MQLTVTQYRTDIAVLALRGELDTDTAPMLDDVLRPLLARPVPRVVVLVTGLEFCDSVGLSAFVVGHLHAVQRGGWIRIAGAGPFLAELLHTLGLTRYLAMYPDVARAAAA